MRIHFRSLAITLAIALSVSPCLAFVIIWDGGHAYIKCADGAMVTCYDHLGNQRHCTTADGVNGCDGHGGIIRIEGGTGPSATCDYQGSLALQFLPGEGEGGGNPVCGTSGWLATCQNGAELSCDDEFQSCPDPLGVAGGLCGTPDNVLDTTVYVTFPASP